MNGRSKPVRLQVLSVALADADPERRARLRATLERDGLEVVREAKAGGAVLSPGAGGGAGASADAVLDAVVLGVDDLEADGLALVERVRDALPDVAIVVVSGSLENRSSRKAFEAGVDAVVLEERVEASLGLAVRAAHAGQLSLPGEWRSQFGKPVLSARQKQVLSMVVMGFTNARIARTLNVAESTVKSHLFAAFTKLGVRSRKEATALILDPESGLGTGILTIPGASAGARGE